MQWLVNIFFKLERQAVELYTMEGANTANPNCTKWGPWSNPWADKRTLEVSSLYGPQPNPQADKRPVEVSSTKTQGRGSAKTPGGLCCFLFCFVSHLFSPLVLLGNILLVCRFPFHLVRLLVPTWDGLTLNCWVKGSCFIQIGGTHQILVALAPWVE